MIVASATFLASLSSVAAELAPFRVSVLPIFDTANLYAALQEGYFKEEGLDVTTQANQQGGVIGIPGLFAGAYDAAYTSTPSIFLAAQQGLALRVIGGTAAIGSAPPDPAALLARTSDHLGSGKDLAGKTIAVNARNNIQWLLARAWVKQTGGDPDRVTYREIPVPQMVDALKSRQTDVAFSIDPFLAAARQDPDIAVLGWPLSVVLPNAQIANYVVTADTARKRPAIVEAFVRGMRKGAAWINTNAGKEPFFRLVNSYTRMDPSLISAMVMKPSQMEIDLRSLKRIEDLMAEQGLLTSEIDPASIAFRP